MVGHQLVFGLCHLVEDCLWLRLLERFIGGALVALMGVLRLVQQCLFLHIRRYGPLAAVRRLGVLRHRGLNLLLRNLLSYLNDPLRLRFLRLLGLCLHHLFGGRFDRLVVGLVIGGLLHIRVVRSLNSVLVLPHELRLHCFVKAVVVVLVRLRVHLFFSLRDHLDVRRIDLHVGRTIVQHGRGHDWHRVGQLAQLVFGVGEATVDPEFAMAADLEILAELRLVIAVKHPNELLAWEALGHWL